MIVMYYDDTNDRAISDVSDICYDRDRECVFLYAKNSDLVPVCCSMSVFSYIRLIEIVVNAVGCGRVADLTQFGRFECDLSDEEVQ